MAYCRRCGAPISDYATTCPSCGAPQNDAPPPVEDNGGIGWGLLGCCIPIVGLVLFLVWNDTKPRTAKAAGIGCNIIFDSPEKKHPIRFTEENRPDAVIEDFRQLLDLLPPLV